MKSTPPLRVSIKLYERWFRISPDSIFMIRWNVHLAFCVASHLLSEIVKKALFLAKPLISYFGFSIGVVLYILYGYKQSSARQPLDSFYPSNNTLMNTLGSSKYFGPPIIGMFRDIEAIFSFLLVFNTYCHCFLRNTFALLVKIG